MTPRTGAGWFWWAGWAGFNEMAPAGLPCCDGSGWEFIYIWWLRIRNVIRSKIPKNNNGSELRFTFHSAFSRSLAVVFLANRLICLYFLLWPVLAFLWFFRWFFLAQVPFSPSLTVWRKLGVGLPFFRTFRAGLSLISAHPSAYFESFFLFTYAKTWSKNFVECGGGFFADPLKIAGRH